MKPLRPQPTPPPRGALSSRSGFRLMKKDSTLCNVVMLSGLAVLIGGIATNKSVILSGGSIVVVRSSNDWLFLMGLVLMLGGFLIPAKRSYRCSECGNSVTAESTLCPTCRAMLSKKPMHPAWLFLMLFGLVAGLVFVMWLVVQTKAP